MLASRAFGSEIVTAHALGLDLVLGSSLFAEIVHDPDQLRLLCSLCLVLTLGLDKAKLELLDLLRMLASEFLNPSLVLAVHHLPGSVLLAEMPDKIVLVFFGNGEMLGCGVCCCLGGVCCCLGGLLLLLGYLSSCEAVGILSGLGYVCVHCQNFFVFIMII